MQFRSQNVQSKDDQYMSIVSQFNHIKGIREPYQTWRIETYFLVIIICLYYQLLYLCQKCTNMITLCMIRPQNQSTYATYSEPPLSTAQQSRVSASKRSSCISFIATGREATSFSKAPGCLVRVDCIFERLGCMLRRDTGIASNNYSMKIAQWYMAIRCHKAVLLSGLAVPLIQRDSPKARKPQGHARLGLGRQFRRKYWSSWKVERMSNICPRLEASTAASATCRLHAFLWYVACARTCMLVLCHPQEWWQPVTAGQHVSQESQEQ